MKHPHRLDRIAFARRQSPDWASLSRDYRAGLPIDPARYVPDHPVPHFPADIVGLIAAWNASFRPDFFTCRSIIGDIAARSLAAVRNAVHFSYEDSVEIAHLSADEHFVLFFHDDDDVFAADVFGRLAATAAWQADTCVFPLYRVAERLVTYVKDGHPAEGVWGSRSGFFYRFHSNNYGLSSRLCTPQHLAGMKDHIAASDYATAQGFGESVLPFAISATIKTPCSASALTQLREGSAAYAPKVADFGKRYADPRLPASHTWLREPLAEIAALFREIAG
jgi:hypothetical protein